MPHHRDENPIRRAAGVILWQLEDGKPESEAVAKASRREPELNEDQLAYALEWARSGQLFAELANRKIKGMTVEELKEAAGIAYYSNPENYPPYDDEV